MRRVKYLRNEEKMSTWEERLTAGLLCELYRQYKHFSGPGNGWPVPLFLVARTCLSVPSLSVVPDPSLFRPAGDDNDADDRAEV